MARRLHYAEKSVLKTRVRPKDQRMSPSDTKRLWKAHGTNANYPSYHVTSAFRSIYIPVRVRVGILKGREFTIGKEKYNVVDNPVTHKVTKMKKGDRLLTVSAKLSSYLHSGRQKGVRKTKSKKSEPT